MVLRIRCERSRQTEYLLRFWAQGAKKKPSLLFIEVGSLGGAGFGRKIRSAVVDMLNVGCL